METLALHHLSTHDPRLAQLIQSIPLPALHSSGDVYYDLVSCLVDQQIHYRTRSIWFKCFLELFPGGYPHPRQVLALPKEEVLAIKLSSRKYESLRVLASWWLQKGEGIRWEVLSDDAVREQLSGLPGVGAWTVEMILLFTLGRPDILPLADYGLKKAVVEHYSLATDHTFKASLEAVAKAWQPYRSLACRYLWATPITRNLTPSDQTTVL